MTRLQTRLILVFLAATAAPFGVTLWVTTSLLEKSLQRASTREIDILSRSLEKTGREFYQRARDSLKKDALAGRIEPVRHLEAGRERWPEPVQEFWSSGEPERFVLSGDEGDQLDYLVRRGNEVWVYSSGFSGVGMTRLSEQYRHARDLVEAEQARDWRRGFIYTYVLLAAAIWLVSLAVLVFLARRVSRPIQRLTAGLTKLAAGDLAARVETHRTDEIGRAIEAFNDMAGQLQQSRDRLVYLTQLASWQALARKMAHEVKNSLTPIRLTMEEMLARGDRDRAFLEQAAQIIIDEVESLERRVRAFSQFAAEPPVQPAPIDVNALVEERIAFLRTAHPEITYRLRLDENLPRAWADEDLVKGILLNLLENAAEAAGSDAIEAAGSNATEAARSRATEATGSNATEADGSDAAEAGRSNATEAAGPVGAPGGTILAATSAGSGQVSIEVHDSGPGLDEQARQSLFQPTITFKKRGMGLGLSIARKSALLSGGDILLVKGELGGAGFRVVLPSCQSESPSSTMKKTSAVLSA